MTFFLKYKGGGMLNAANARKCFVLVGFFFSSLIVLVLCGSISCLCRDIKRWSWMTFFAKYFFSSWKWCRKICQIETIEKSFYWISLLHFQERVWHFFQYIINVLFCQTDGGLVGWCVGCAIGLNCSAAVFKNVNLTFKTLPDFITKFVEFRFRGLINRKIGSSNLWRDDQFLSNFFSQNIGLSG